MAKTVAVWLALASVVITGCKPSPTPTGNAKAGIHTIALDLKGDSALREKFDLLLQAELVGSGIRIITGDRADAVLTGELKQIDKTENYAAAIVRQDLTVDGKTRTVGSCPVLDSSYDELIQGNHDFEQDIPGIYFDLKHAFPDMKTIYLDAASTFANSPNFRRAFANYVWDQGAKVVEEPPAAISDRITLSLRKVTALGTLVQYKFDVKSSSEDIFNESGNSGMQDTHGDDIPPFCLKDFKNFNTDLEPLIEPAHRLVAAVQFANSGSKPAP